MNGTRNQAWRYRFAGFELDPCERRLLANGRPVALAPKVFDTLVILVEHAGHAVSKDELVAALWPRGFVQESNLTKQIWAIRKVLDEGEDHPQFIETIPKLGYRFTAAVERIESTGFIDFPASFLPDSDRPAGHDDVALAAQALGPDAVATERVSPNGAMPTGGFDDPLGVRALAPAYTNRKRGRLAVVAVSAVVIIAVAMGVFWRLKPDSGLIRVSNPPGTAVAIVKFNNLSGNTKDAWLGPALTEMLATEVTTGGKLHVLPSEVVRPAQTGLVAPGAGGYAPTSLAKLRQRLGADYVLSGSYLVSGTGPDAEVRVDLVLQDARSQVEIAGFSLTRPSAALPQLVTGAGVELRGKLGLQSMTPSASRQLASAQPPTEEVARRMGFALDALHNDDPTRARDELVFAIAQDPGYAPAQALLARAWSELGYHDKALAAIDQAAINVAGLPEAERLQIQAQQHALSYDNIAAAADYRKLIALRPDDPEPRRQFILVLSGTDRIAEAEQALQDWRRLPGAAMDPRWELVANRVANDHGDVSSAMAHAQRALELATQEDAPGLKAEAELRYGWDLGTGSTDARQQNQGQKLLRQATMDYRALGDVFGEAHGYEAQGEAWNDLNPKAANDALQKAMILYQRIGAQDGQAKVLGYLSRALWKGGDSDGAVAALERAIGIYRATSDFSDEVRETAGLAQILSDRSDGAGVVALYRKLQGMETRLGDRHLIAYTQANYGELLRERGQLEDARKACAQAKKMAIFKGSKKFPNTIQVICAGVERDNGDVTGASALLEQAVRDPDGYAYRSSFYGLVTVIPLAKIEMAQGRWATARKLLQPWTIEGATPAEERARTTIEAQTNALTALCDQALGDDRARKRTTVRAAILRQRITEHHNAFEVDLALDQVEGEAGDRKEAVAKLLALSDDARKRYWVASSLEARLAAYRLLHTANDAQAGVMHDEIGSEARKDGFKWVLMRLDGSASLARGTAGQ